MNFIKLKLKALQRKMRLYDNWIEVCLHNLNILKGDYIVKINKNFYVQKKQIRFLVRSGSSDLTIIEEIFYYSIYGSHVPGSKIIYDIGGHVGIFSTWCKSFSYPTIVHSFEPDRDNLVYLNYNNKLNNVDGYIYNYGIWNRNGKVPLYSDTPSTYSLIDNKNKGSYNINVIDIRNLIRYSLKPIDLLKMDIEGAEYDVIMRCRKKEFDMIRNMIFEIHPHIIDMFKQVQMLNHLRYNGYNLQVRGNIIVATKKKG